MAPSRPRVVDVSPTGQVTVDVDATGQEVREAEVRPEPREGRPARPEGGPEGPGWSGPTSPAEDTDTNRSVFQRRYLPNGGGKGPFVEMDGPGGEPPGPPGKDPERRLTSRDIDDLLNDLDILDEDED